MRSVVGRLLPLALILVVSACSDMTEPVAFGQARERWDSENLHSYQYVGLRDCFCGPLGPVVVTVVNDEVVGVVDQESGAPSPIEGWMTVEEVFEEIERAYERERLQAVDFHVLLGYPTLVEICCQENDSGLTLTITDLHAT